MENLELKLTEENIMTWLHAYADVMSTVYQREDSVNFSENEAEFNAVKTNCLRQFKGVTVRDACGIPRVNPEEILQEITE